MSFAGFGGFPLSPQQRRVWDLSRGSSVFRSEALVRVSEGVDATRLRRAIEDVVAGRQILRMTFRQYRGLGFLLQAPVELNSLVWNANRDVPEEDVEHIVQEERREPFDLESGRVLRARWIESGEIRYLMLSLPALCADSRSLAILVRDIASAYDSGGPVSDELPYVQFAQWQNDLRRDPDAKVVALWRAQDLTGFTSAQLPFREPPAGSAEPAATGDLWHVPSHVSARIERISAECGTSPAAVWLGVWSEVLMRLTGSASVVVGEFSDGRELPPSDTAPGLFTRVVPVRLSAAPELAFVSQVRRSAAARSNALEWADHFQLEGGDAGRFSFGFAYEEYVERHAVANGTLTIEAHYQVVDVPLVSLHVARSEARMTATLQFDPRRLAREDAGRILRYLSELSEATSADSAVPVGSLSSFNETSAQHAHACLHHGFAAVAARHPGRTAVVFRESSLNYADLDKRANRLAHYLQRLGVGAETRVGVLLDRSLDALVAVMGIWKAGGAYVPLDPMRPERLAFILKDASVRVVLTQEKLRSFLPEGGPSRFELDREWNRLVSYSYEAPVSGVEGHHLAYVIYTSGTTGEPKGVMVCHASLVNLTDALRSAVYEGREIRRVSLNAPLTFDSSIKQLATLALGCTLDVIPEDVRANGVGLLNYLQAHSIDVFDCTPFQFRQLREAGWHDPGTRPRCVLLGGERIDATLWRALQQDSRTEFFNLYGPTECTVDVAVAKVSAHHPEAVVGKPLANVRAYVVDEHMEIVPPGVTGELLVGGKGVARGYLGRAYHTAASFVPDPFGSVGERLYRTGDKARCQVDGNIAVLGRTDRQMKVCGCRVEPGEIEEVLRRHPGVRDAVVVARNDGQLDMHLVAYVVPAAREPATFDELRDLVRETLPEYMVPARWMWLPRLPLTSHGKLDLDSLPEVHEDAAVNAAAYIQPRNEIESAIAQIWREELQVDRVGMRDNFFDLGGHSLLMTRVQARLRARFDRDISLIEMFCHPTVESLTLHFLGQAVSQHAMLTKRSDGLRSIR